MAPTLSTGTLLAGGAAALFLSAPASAETYNWNLRGETQGDITLQSGDRLNLADGQGTGLPVYGTGEDPNAAKFTAGAITVGSGAELFLHGNRSTVAGTGAGGKMTITAGITLQDNSKMIIEDGSYSLAGNDKHYLVVQGTATLHTNWTKYYYIQNLFGEANATLNLESGNVEGRAPAMYVLARTTSPSNPHNLLSWNGTLVVNTPDAMSSLDTFERVAVVLNGGNILGSNSDIQLNHCGALWLNANSITLPKLTNVGGTTYLRHNAGTNNARQILSNVVINTQLNLLQLTGAQQVSWVFNKLSGAGSLSWYPWADHYNPSVIYVNGDNSDFEGTVRVSPDFTKSYFGYHPYQRFLQLNSTNALKNATLSLSGMTGTSTNYSTLALNATHINIKKLSGGEQGLVYAGEVSMSGTASAPVTDVRPSSNMLSYLTLGTGTLESDNVSFLGTILEYVHIIKDGSNEQTIATLSQDTTRTVSVTGGTLTLGSIGSLRSLVVSPGARANVGLNVDDSGKMWGKWDEQHAYTTAHAVSLSDTTRFRGNIVATDEIYGTGMAYLNYSEPGMKVTRFDATGYTGDTITLKMGALSVFDPASRDHVQLDFGSVKRIILEGGTGLVAAGPDQTGARDPKINVTQDLEIRGVAYLRAMGTVTRDEETGFYTKVDAYNTTYSGSFYGNNASIHKSDYGTVTLTGDLSEYGGGLYVDEGRLILSGGVKNLSVLAGGAGNPGSYPASADSSYIDLVNNTTVTTGRFQIGDHSNDWAVVEKGSVLNVTNVGNEKAYAPNDNGLSLYCGDSTFLIGSKNGRTELTIDGTVNMLNCGYISTGVHTQIGSNADGAIYASHSVTVRDGGVLNMKGLALQVWEDGTKTDLIIQSGGTLNLGEDGLASYDVTTVGKSKGEGYDNLRLTFEKGSTLGILDSAAEWSSSRAIVSDGLTVNTQGYIPNLGGTGTASYGSATGLGRTINLGHFRGSLTKTGLGLLRVAANSVLDRLTVNQGFFAVTADINYVTGGVMNLTTTGSGSLLFNLTETIDWNNPSGGYNQESINLLGDVNGTVNITVRPGTDTDARGEYRILDGSVPTADRVHLTALIEDGWVAKYEKVDDNNRKWGVVKVTYDANALVGIKDELNWQITGETNVWANSTDKNWLATGGTSNQRFVNGNATAGFSSVVFDADGGMASEEVTLLDSVLVNNMTVKSAGWCFLGEGGITGAGTLTVENGASATFSNTKTNYFDSIDIQEGGLLRLSFLDSTCSNWDGVTFGGAGTLEIATGANHALASNNGLRFGELAELKLANGTSFDIQTTNAGVAESLANPHKITVEAGSHIGLNANSLQKTNTTGRELHLAGAGNESASSEALASALGIAYHENYTTKPGSAIQNYTIANHVYLDNDATIYVAAKVDETAHNGYITGNYISQGHILTKTGLGLLGIGSTTASVGSGSDFSGGFNIQEGTLLLNLHEEGELLSDTKKVVQGSVTIGNRARLNKAGGHIELAGGLSVNGTAYISSSSATGITVSSVVSGDNESAIYLNPPLNVNVHDTLVLTADNTRKETAAGGTGFAGTWDLTNWTLRAEHTNALADATVTLFDNQAVLELGNTADYYTVRGLDGLAGSAMVQVVEGGSSKTLEIRSDDLHTYYGNFGSGLSIIMNGRGGQSLLNRQLFDKGFDGDITVTAGMLEVYSLNGLLNTNVTVADANARLRQIEKLVLGTVGSFTANKNGAVLEGQLDLTQGGSLLLGANGKVWDKGDVGLDLDHHMLSLSTSNKASLDLSLSAFLEAGDTVTLFSKTDRITIDGQDVTYLDQLGTLGDYFDVSTDINLPGAKVVYTSDHQLQIILNKASNGLYWEWKGGNGTWDLDRNNIAWSPKDNHEASVGFQNGYAAYFTDENGTASIGVTDTVRVSEMAVRNGIYNFTIGAGKSLTIENSLYEKQDGEAHFFLENGSTLSIGSATELAASTIETVSGQSDVATLVVGDKLQLSDKASIKGVNLQLAALAGSAAGATLDLTDTTDSSIAALNGYGKVTAQGGELLISNMRDGNFTGEFAGTTGTAPGGETLYNVLTIEEGNGNTQTFEQVKTNDSWQIVNNGSMVFNPANGSSLNSLTLGAGSNTTLTLNTDEAGNGLSLSTLTVDKDIAGLTINSTGKRALTRTEYTLLEAADQLNMEEGTPIEVNLGDGVFFKRVDKTKGATVTKDGNKLVLNVEFTDKNTYADFVSDPNASAGAGMLWDIDSGSLGADSDLARLDAYTYSTVEKGNKPEAERIMAAAAGASTAVLGAAFSSDVERQLKAIRNRTTTMGVNQCEVNENMPYFNAWINAEGNFRDLSADGLQSGYSLNSWGGTVGFDADVNPYLTLGLALTGMYGDLETDGADKAEGDFDTTYLSAFARVAYRAWVHTVVATVGRADVTLDRTVNFGSDSYTAHGSTDGTAFGLMYEAGRTIAMNEDASVCLQPVFNVVFRHSSISGYEEEQTDAALKIGDQDFTTLTFGLGARLQAIVGENLYNRTSIFEARALLKVDAGDRQGEADVALLHSAGQKSYTIEAAEVGAVGIELGAGMTIPVGADNGSIFFDASCELRSGYTDINGTVGYRVNF